MTDTLLDIRDFGAACNDVADDTTEIQNAIDAAEGGAAQGIRLYGNPNVTTLTVNQSIAIEGDGSDLVFLNATDTTKPAIKFDPIAANRKLRCSGFTVGYSAPTANGAAALHLGNATHNHIGTVIEDVSITSASTGIYFLNAINQTIKNCTVQSFYGDAIRIYNPLLPDSGGAIIRDNQFIYGSSTGPVACAIDWNCGGGILVSGNKMLGAMANGLKINMTGQTTEFQFTDNLLFGCTQAGIQMEAGSGLELMQMVVSGNIFDSCLMALNVPENGRTPAWVKGLLFTDNVGQSVFNLNSTMVSLSDVDGFVVANNAFYSNGSAPQMIYTGASSSNGVIGPNVRNGSWGANNLNAANSLVIGNG